MAQPEPHPFWRFSLQRYARPGVPDLCLSAQERRGADVNLLLFSLWLGTEGRALAPGAALACAHAVGDWHDAVVRPLRAVRCRMKGWQIGETNAREALRHRIKDAEIEAERQEQDLLYALYLAQGATVTQPEPDTDAAMLANLSVMLALWPEGSEPLPPGWTTEMLRLTR